MFLGTAHFVPEYELALVGDCVSHHLNQAPLVVKPTVDQSITTAVDARSVCLVHLEQRSLTGHALQMPIL